MTLTEFFKLVCIIKKRLKTLNFAKLCPNKILKTCTEFLYSRKFKAFCTFSSKLAFCTKSTTAGNKKLGIFRNNDFIILKLKSFYKTIAERIHKMQRTAKKCYVTANWFTAGKTRNCLVYYSLINGSSNIFTAGTFVYERLNICLCKNTTTGSNRINCLSTFCQLIKASRISFQQSSHLVNERTSTTSTSTVHALFNTAGKICNLGIFSAKLNNNISLWNYFLYSRCSRNNFLNKRNIKPLGNRKSARTSNLYSQRLIFTKRKLTFQLIKCICSNLNNCAADICTVSLIISINKLIVIIKYSNFYSC